jgi:hypothetical protein
MALESIEQLTRRMFLTQSPAIWSLKHPHAFVGDVMFPLVARQKKNPCSRILINNPALCSTEISWVNLSLVAYRVNV